jgi:hypothetical protein
MHDNLFSMHSCIRAMADSRWKRVSARRYAVQVSLCILTVYVSSYMAQLACPTAMIWIIAPYFSLVISFATHFGPPGVPASRTYCFITTVVLLYLDKAATAIGDTAEPSFNQSAFQHRAVHFALAFFVLSELEYHRQYFAAKGLDKINTSTCALSSQTLIPRSTSHDNHEDTSMCYLLLREVNMSQKGDWRQSATASYMSTSSMAYHFKSSAAV